MSADEVPAVGIPAPRWVAVHQEHEPVAYQRSDGDVNLGDHSAHVRRQRTLLPLSGHALSWGTPDDATIRAIASCACRRKPGRPLAERVSRGEAARGPDPECSGLL